jgi:hypothetical protein
MHFIGPSGISGYAPWATLPMILIVVGGALAGVMLVTWLLRRKNREVADAETSI